MEKDSVRIGSYPSFGRGVYISLIGLDKRSILALGKEIAKDTDGYVVTEKELDSRVKFPAQQALATTPKKKKRARRNEATLEPGSFTPRFIAISYFIVVTKMHNII